MFKKYESTSQIASLPGCVKRASDDILDDKKYINRSSNKSFCAKVVRDYKSNVACLPGKLIHEEAMEKSRLVLAKKFENNNIFNFEESKSNNNYNTVYQGKSLRKSSSILNVFDTTNNEKELFDKNKKSRRPSGMRNMFESQISVLK